MVGSPRNPCATGLGCPNKTPNEADAGARAPPPRCRLLCDGVHLGQDDMTSPRPPAASSVRAVASRRTTAARSDRAILDGAVTSGVGPVFPSATKAFADLAGLAFVAQAANFINPALVRHWRGSTSGPGDGSLCPSGGREYRHCSAERPRQATAALGCARLDSLGSDAEPDRSVGADLRHEYLPDGLFLLRGLPPNAINVYLMGVCWSMWHAPRGPSYPPPVEGARCRVRCTHARPSRSSGGQPPRTSARPAVCGAARPMPTRPRTPR